MSEHVSTQGTGRQKTVGLHRGAKSLIRNVMRHTDNHNRHLEESEMWQIHYRMTGANPNDKEDDKKGMSTADKSKDEKGGNNEAGGMGFRDPDIHNSFLYDERRDMRWEGTSRRGMQRAHMDDCSDEDRNIAASSKSTFWIRQLYKAEETDPDRWGHAGFKELYPDDFDSDRSAASDDSDKKKSKKKKHHRKRHKHKHLTKKKKQKKTNDDTDKKKKKKRKNCSDKEKKKRKRKKSSDESDDESSDSSKRDRKTMKVRNSNETSESGSESENESKRKRDWRNMKIESERNGEVRDTSTEKSHRHKKRRKH